MGGGNYFLKWYTDDQSKLKVTTTHSFEALLHAVLSHHTSLTHSWHRCQGQFRAQCLVQGHGGLWTGGARNQTIDLVWGRPALPPDMHTETNTPLLVLSSAQMFTLTRHIHFDSAWFFQHLQKIWLWNPVMVMCLLCFALIINQKVSFAYTCSTVHPCF